MRGILNAVNSRFLETHTLGIDVTLAAYVALVLGGTMRVWGAVIGGVLALGFFDILVQGYLPLPASWYGQAIPNIREMAFGAVLIIVLMYRPLGILGTMRRDKLMRSMHSD